MTHPTTLHALEVRNLTVRRGARLIACPDMSLKVCETRALSGPSGVGKTSLLLAMAGILRPDSGEVHVCGQAMWTTDEEGRARLRGQAIGYVFASFHLIWALNVMDNLQMARTCAGMPKDIERARQLLARLDVSALAYHRADQISQGQMQRVALARALMNRPSVLLCDEPTSALDDAATWRLIDLLQEMAIEESLALLVATHDRRVMDALGGLTALTYEEGHA